jgi:hypothetical protein
MTGASHGRCSDAGVERGYKTGAINVSVYGGGMYCIRSLMIGAAGV